MRKKWIFVRTEQTYLVCEGNFVVFDIKCFPLIFDIFAVFDIFDILADRDQTITLIYSIHIFRKTLG